MVSTKRLCSTTVCNIDNDNKYLLRLNQHIIMISEGSCDTEDWSNNAENHNAMTENQLCITGINYILQYIQIENSYFKL